MLTVDLPVGGLLRPFATSLTAVLTVDLPAGGLLEGGLLEGGLLAGDLLVGDLLEGGLLAGDLLVVDLLVVDLPAGGLLDPEDLPPPVDLPEGGLLGVPPAPPGEGGLGSLGPCPLLGAPGGAGGPPGGLRTGVRAGLTWGVCCLTRPLGRFGGALAGRGGGVTRLLGGGPGSREPWACGRGG